MNRSRILKVVMVVVAMTVSGAAPAGRVKVKNGTIHGVIRAGAQNLEHIQVRLVNRRHMTHSNETGGFEFKDVGPGVRTLVAHTRHHGSGRVTFMVNPGQKVDVVLVMRPQRVWHHWWGGVATPGHTPGRVATP
ncbi:MAG TPA: hypothetical protein VFE58_11765 [Tepidisphaeraceae bacterium]|jgi:hypothetical protein|nr:hypothetical protein [Tepidisphaeraceae bacterium]